MFQMCAAIGFTAAVLIGGVGVIGVALAVGAIGLEVSRYATA